MEYKLEELNEMLTWVKNIFNPVEEQKIKCSVVDLIQTEMLDIAREKMDLWYSKSNSHYSVVQTACFMRSMEQWDQYNSLCEWISQETCVPTQIIELLVEEET